MKSPPGILENAYVSWQVKGIGGFFPLEALILNCKKTYELFRHQYIKIVMGIKRSKTNLVKYF